MAYDIQQSTTQSPLLFVMVSSTDHITGATGLSPTVTIRKVGGAFASPSGAITEIANGWYQVAPNATDVNTLGPIALHATATGADPTDIVVANVVAYNPQDATALGLSRIDAAVSSRMATFTLPTNFSAFSIDASGNVTTALPISPVVQSGTAQAGGNNTITLSAGASSTNNIYGGNVIRIYAGTGAGQSRVCQQYNGTTKVQNVDNNWTVNPDATSQYAIMVYHGPATDNGQNVIVGTNNDKTGYSLTQTFPTNFSALGITVGGAVTAGTVSDKTGYELDATGSAALTESYRANGAAGTITQLLYEILAHLSEASISGTTKTVNKLDHTTAAATYTLDSATTPTSIKRAT